MISGMDRHAPPEFPTVRQAARASGIGEKTLRRWVHEGSLPLYYADTERPHLYWPEVVARIKATRRARPGSEVKARVEEALRREETRKSA